MEASPATKVTHRGAPAFGRPQGTGLQNCVRKTYKAARLSEGTVGDLITLLHLGAGTEGTQRRHQIWGITYPNPNASGIGSTSEGSLGLTPASCFGCGPEGH